MLGGVKLDSSSAGCWERKTNPRDDGAEVKPPCLPFGDDDAREPAESDRREVCCNDVDSTLMLMFPGYPSGSAHSCGAGSADSAGGGARQWQRRAQEIGGVRIVGVCDEHVGRFAPRV